MMNNKILAAGSVALIGAGSFMAATPAQAYTDADCGTVPTGATLTLIDGEICSVLFDADSSTDWDVPTGYNRIAAVIVGAGGAAVSFSGCGYGGGGGQVLYIDDVDPADIASLTVGAPGDVSTGYAGNYTLLGNSLAAGGYLGDDDATFGWSGNGNISAYAGSDLHGGGAKSAATADGPGAGYVLSDPELTENDPLFPDTGSTDQWGRGGSGTTSPLENAYGTGGHVGSAGTQGAAVFRWSLTDVKTDSETPLASTGVDANSIGMTAGALGLGGVALAVVAAARRARRSK